MNIYESIKEMKKVVDERDKLKNTVQNYQQYAEELQQISQRLIELSKTIDPYRTLSNAVKNSSGLNKKQLIAEFHQKLLDGTQITREIIQSTYNDLVDWEAGYILTELAKKPQVKKVRDGVQVRLYM